MSSAGIERKIGEAEKRKARLEAERQAIVDRQAFLDGQSKALAYPAHHKGDAKAKAELKKANADVLMLHKSLEATDRLIEKAGTKLQGLEVDMKQAQADETTGERDRLEAATLGKWLEAHELREQATSAQIEFEGLRERVEEKNARLRSMGRSAPGFVIIHGSEERQREEVKSRIRALGAKVPA